MLNEVLGLFFSIIFHRNKASCHNHLASLQQWIWLEIRVFLFKKCCLWLKRNVPSLSAGLIYLFLKYAISPLRQTTYITMKAYYCCENKDVPVVTVDWNTKISFLSFINIYYLVQVRVFSFSAKIVLLIRLIWSDLQLMFENYKCAVFYRCECLHTNHKWLYRSIAHHDLGGSTEP